MRLLLLALAAWVGYRIAEENRLLPGSQPLLAAPARAPSRRPPARRRTARR